MINKSTMDKIIKINEQRERDVNPLYCLGRRLLDGDGVEQDKSLGMEVIRIVAEQGNVLFICPKEDSSALVRKYVNEVQMQKGEDYV